MKFVKTKIGKNSPKQKAQKRTISLRRKISLMLAICVLTTLPTSCKGKKNDETTSKVESTTNSQSQTETETQKVEQIKKIDLKKYKLKDDKSIFDITKLVKKQNKDKNNKLVSACAMSYTIGESRVIRLLYSHSKGGVIKQYIVKEYLLDTNKMSDEEYKFNVKDGGGKGGLKVISLEDLIFSDETNKRIYAPDYLDKEASYSKIGSGEVFAYNGKPFVFDNSKMAFYEVTAKGKLQYNFKLLREKYSSAKLISYNKLKYVQIEAVSPFERKKIYMDIDPGDNVINKYTMDKYDEYFEEYGDGRYYELNYDKNNAPGIYLYDKKSNIRVRKSIPKSITKLCNGSSKKVSVTSDAVIDDSLLFSVNSGNSISNLYLWNLKKGKTQKHTFTAKNPFEFTEKQMTADALRQRANELEDEYGVYIYFGDDAETNYGSYITNRCTDSGQIEAGLNSLETVLSMYPKGFFRQLDYGNVKGIYIHLTGSIMAADSGGIPAGVLAFTGVTTNNTQIVVIDITQMMQISTIAHEITHMIDRKLEYEGFLDDGMWSKLNPNGFEYRNEYIDESGNQTFDSITGDYLYMSALFGNESYDNVYFYDDYAKTYSTEDRARIIEVLATDTYDQDSFLKCPHIKKKLQKYMELLESCFDTIDWSDSLWKKRINSI